MKKIFILLMILLLCSTAFATPIRDKNTNARLGAFTGGEDDTEQDDNIKASLDFAHTDLDSIIATLEDSTGIVGLGGTGAIYYVDSGEATGTETGLTWATATDTVDEAIILAQAAALADTGAIILIAAGHAETLVAADDVDVDTAGLKFIGLGVGENRPTFTYTADGEWVIAADDTELHNLNFIAGDAVVHAIDVEAGMENFVINNCHFQTTVVNTDEFIDAIDIAAGSDNGKITNCLFEAGAAAAVSAITNVGSDYVEISGNTIIGDYSRANIVDATTKSIWLVVKDNILVNGDTAGGLNTEPCIEIKADTSALVIDNTIFCDMTETTSIVSAVGFLAGNRYNETAGSVLEVGKSYVISMTSLLIDDTLFTVAGGSISITSLVGEITTVSQTQANDIEIACDADNTFDFDFTTAVEVSGDLDGDRYVFDDTEGEAVLTPCTGADGGAGGTMTNWYCPAGKIILNAVQATHSGNVLWYMTFTPLAEGVTVVAGP